MSDLRQHCCWQKERPLVSSLFRSCDSAREAISRILTRRSPAGFLAPSRISHSAFAARDVTGDGSGERVPERMRPRRGGTRQHGAQWKRRDAMKTFIHVSPTA